MNAAEMDVNEVLENSRYEIDQPHTSEDLCWEAFPHLLALLLERLDTLNDRLDSISSQIRGPQ